MAVAWSISSCVAAHSSGVRSNGDARCAFGTMMPVPGRTPGGSVGSWDEAYTHHSFSIYVSAARSGPRSQNTHSSAIREASVPANEDGPPVVEGIVVQTMHSSCGAELRPGGPAAALPRLVDDADAVALGVGEDDVVDVRRRFPDDPCRAEREEPLDLRSLIFGVQVEVDPRPSLGGRGPHVEVQVGRIAARGNEHLRRRVRLRAPHVSERRLPERGLLLQVVHGEHDRADVDAGPGHHSARRCRMLMLSMIPSASATLISEAPPWLMNGRGTPG